MDGLRPTSGISLSSPSPRSARFSHYDIASGRPTNKIPTSLKTWVVGGTVLSMLVLAAVIEVALFYSNNHNGFPMGHLDTDQVQWLSAFLPTLAMGPLVWIWTQMDKDFKKLQPYITLLQGPSRAEETVLLNLERDNMFKIVRHALVNRQTLVIGTSLIVMIAIFLHPLAGALFLVKPGVVTGSSDIFAHRMVELGLNPSFKDLTSFVAAAGYAEAAAMYDLADPPFVRGGWAVAPFQLPLDATRTATISVKTIGVYTSVSCSSLDVKMTPSMPDSRIWTLSASLPARPGCNTTQAVDSSAAEFQYGVDLTPGCALNAPDGISRRDGEIFTPYSVPLLWFASIPRRTLPPNKTIPRSVSDTPAGSAAICAPSIMAYSVEAIIDGATGLLVGVNRMGDVDEKANNVTGGDFAGKAFNGVSFNGDPDFNLTDPFVNARAVAVQSGILGAIFRMALGPKDEGVDAVFRNATVFVGLTKKIYTQYLSLVALSNYFISTDDPVKADIAFWPDRLWISPTSAHFLAGLLVLVAVAGAFIHLIHHRKRKRLYLASHPGSMAHYMSLFSDPEVTSPRLKDGESGSVMHGILGPLDDEKAMQDKLIGVRFMLDERSGNIMPVSAGESLGPRNRREPWSCISGYELEDPTKALLGPRFHIEGSPI